MSIRLNCTTMPMFGERAKSDDSSGSTGPFGATSRSGSTITSSVGSSFVSEGTMGTNSSGTVNGVLAAGQTLGVPAKVLGWIAANKALAGFLGIFGLAPASVITGAAMDSTLSVGSTVALAPTASTIGSTAAATEAVKSVVPKLNLPS